jgi:membrane fusion protein (multidrug efflux system)
MVLFLLTIISCGKKTVEIPPPAKVTVVRAIQKDVAVYEDFIAQTYGLSDVDIRSRVDGWVVSIHFKEGSAVRKGDLLYTIDDIQYKASVDQQASEVAKANAEMVRAQNELSRVRPLTEANALSQKDLDNAIASYDAAKAQVKAIIGISNARVGDYVKAVGGTSILSTISSIGSVRVRFQISEREYLRLAKMTKEELKSVKNVQLLLADETIYSSPGTVNFADRQIDPKTGTMTIEATFPNPEGLLRPGLFVKVRVLMTTVRDAVLIPQRAVFQLQSLFQVFSVTDSSTLRATMIQTGPKSGDGWVITQGIKSGDKIAIVGNASITPATKIEEVMMEWPVSDPKKQ